VIEPEATLIERIGALQGWELVNADERPSHQPDDWWKGPVSSSIRGSVPNRFRYQGRLRSRSLTISAT
jgi:hypothetical protein